MVQVLGILVDDDLLHRWRGWFCPAEQPFEVAALPADLRRLVPDGPEAEPTAEVRDTFLVYSRGWRMFSRQSFDELPPAVRRALVRGRDETLRPLRWPDDLASSGDGPLVAYVEVGVLPSRQTEVDEDTWQRASTLLPRARQLAGTFAEHSGPNCFGTVMAAAGVPGAADEWMLREPFEAWLAAATEPVGRGHDDEPGTVLFWRDGDGLLQHAAVTLGDGWALHKPSQAWCSPRLVWTVRDVVLRSRRPGCRLERHRIVG